MAKASCLYLRGEFPNAQLYGFDMSLNAIRRAKQLVDARYAILDVECSRPTQRFDFVISSDVIEHIVDDMAALRNIYAATNKYALIATVQGRMRSFETAIGRVRSYDYGEFPEKMRSRGLQGPSDSRVGLPVLLAAVSQSLRSTQRRRDQPRQLWATQARALPRALRLVLAQPARPWRCDLCAGEQVACGSLATHIKHMSQYSTDYVRYAWQMLSGFRAEHQRALADLRARDLGGLLGGQRPLDVLDLANGRLRPQFALLKAAGHRIYGVDFVNRPAATPDQPCLWHRAPALPLEARPSTGGYGETHAPMWQRRASAVCEQ